MNGLAVRCHQKRPAPSPRPAEGRRWRREELRRTSAAVDVGAGRTLETRSPELRAVLLGASIARGLSCRRIASGFLDDANAGAGADARGSIGDHRFHLLEITDAAG